MPGVTDICGFSIATKVSSNSSTPFRSRITTCSNRIIQGETTMARVLVLYYSAYGHIETMANAVAEGAREGGASVDIRRVPELVPEDVARKSYYKVDQKAPIAKIEDLANYDAIVVGAGTRFGRLASQMANFLDQKSTRL